MDVVENTTSWINLNSTVTSGSYKQLPDVLVYLILFSVVLTLLLLASFYCWYSKFKKSLSVYDGFNESLKREQSTMDRCFEYCCCCDLIRFRKLLKNRFVYRNANSDSNSENIPILGSTRAQSLQEDETRSEESFHKTNQGGNSASSSPKVWKQRSLQLPSHQPIETEKLVRYESAGALTGSSWNDNNSSADGGAAESYDPSERRAILHEKRRRTISAGDSFDDPPHLGTILFKLEYDFDNFSLFVTVHRASDLPIMDEQTGSCNPYIKISILPEKKHKARTRMLQNTRNAEYEETFTFENIPYMHLRVTAKLQTIKLKASTQNITLNFLVLSFDKFSRDDVIGEVTLPLQTIDLSSHPVAFCKDVEPTVKQKGHGLGELLISLCYQPASSRLTVVVMKARHLPKMDVTGSADPYVKLTLRQSGERSTKKRTHTKKRTLNPIFNESFLFDVTSEDISSSQLICEVLDYDIGKQDDYIGQVIVSSDAPDRMGCQHWKKVLANPRKQISEWHQIMNPADLSKAMN